MLYRDAFKRIKKDRLVVVCMATIVVCAILALLTLVPGLVSEPKDSREGKDPVTGLDFSYHPPTPLLALGIRQGVKAEDTFSKVKGEPAPADGLDEVFSGGFLGSAAWRHPLGTDKAGRDVLSMTLHGLRWAFIIGFITTAISVVIAVPLGALAGFFGGFIDDAIVWFYTTLASVPFLLLLIAIISIIPDDLKNVYGMWAVLVVIGIVTWVGLARLIRAEFMKHKQREYVQACRGLGYSNARIIFAHILPNVSHIVIITFTIGFVSSVNTEVFLTFVGAGAGPADMTWGRIITTAKVELSRQPSVWWPLATATGMLFILSLAFSIFGDALRDALDPKLRR
jgi:peptide/nickel transport system permease protein